MFAKLTLVTLGFFVLMLVLMVIGYVADTYYTAEESSKDLEFVKQNAFAAGLKTEGYLRAELAAERMSQETFDTYMTALSAQRQEREASKPKPLPRRPAAPPPSSISKRRCRRPT